MEMYTNIKFESTNKSYTFKTEDPSIKVGDFVVVETNRGLEIGTCVSELRDASNLPSDMEVKPILRVATAIDVEQARYNEDLSRDALKICQEEADALNLEMRVVSAEYTLDRAKVTFIYVANDRVDFRELLKVLAAIFKCRIDLRQIGARDKAKIVSGIGVCGHELCCGRFLNDFDMVSFNMAKNQGLALNTTKLSGHCGKLMCCLKYEDEAYTDAKKDFPKINTPCEYNGDIWKLNNINIINSTVRLECQGNFVTISFAEFFKNCNYKDKKDVDISLYEKPAEEENPQEKPFEILLEEPVAEEPKENRHNNHKKRNNHKHNKNKENREQENTSKEVKEKPVKETKDKPQKEKLVKEKQVKEKASREKKENTQKDKKENSSKVFKPKENKQDVSNTDGEKKPEEGNKKHNHHRRHYHNNKKKTENKEA